MFRSSFVIYLILISLILSSSIDGKDIRKRKRQLLSTTTHKSVSIKICGSNLVRVLDMICDKARQLIMNKQNSLSLGKRQMMIDDDPFTRTLVIKDYARK